MATVKYRGAIKEVLKREEYRINQGDFVFCKATMEGARDFWGIYSSSLKAVISLDGAGSDYIRGERIYLNDSYSYWTVTERITCDDAIIEISKRPGII